MPARTQNPCRGPRDDAVPAVEWREIFAEVGAAIAITSTCRRTCTATTGEAAPKVPAAARLCRLQGRPQLRHRRNDFRTHRPACLYRRRGFGPPEAAVCRPARRPFRTRRSPAATATRQIFAGQNEEERYRSPLTEVGVDVHQGDTCSPLTAVNSRPAPTVLTLLLAPRTSPSNGACRAAPTARRRAPSATSPLGSESALLYLASVAGNRARVDRTLEPRAPGLYPHPGHGGSRHP